jgi:TIR domain
MRFLTARFRGFRFEYWLEGKMKVFISWSGERSQRLAEALYEWVPMVLQSVDPWLSQTDIAAGERWADKIAKELEVCSFGIICLTQENIVSPWILFEAGALAKNMQKGRVIPLLLDIDIKDVAGPLAQFQAKKAEKGGLFDVIKAINQLSDTKVSDTQLPKQFEAMWPQLEHHVRDIPTNPPAAKQHRPEQEILEDLVSTVRSLDRKMQGMAEAYKASEPGDLFDGRGLVGDLCEERNRFIGSVRALIDNLPREQKAAAQTALIDFLMILDKRPIEQNHLIQVMKALVDKLPREHKEQMAAAKMALEAFLTKIPIRNVAANPKASDVFNEEK